MDYHYLAGEFMRHMLAFRTTTPHANMDESIRGEVFMLQYITDRGTDVTPSEISRTMNVSSARIAQALNNLERKNLISRRIDPMDRRKVLVTVTEDGKKYAASRYRSLLDQTAFMLAELGEKDAFDYVRIMGRLAQIIRRGCYD